MSTTLSKKHYIYKKNPKNVQRLHSSIAQLTAGQGSEREIDP